MINILRKTLGYSILGALVWGMVFHTFYTLGICVVVGTIQYYREKKRK